MAETSSADVQRRLHEIARLLREVHHLSPDAQRRLAELADELGNSYGSGEAATPEATRLTASTAQLIESLQRRESGGTLSAARDRVEQAVLGAEATSPFLAGVARRLLDTLAGLGI